MASQLESLQSWFFEVVTHPRGVSEALTQVASRPALASSSPATAIVDGRIKAVQRLEVYHRGYAARLVECLQDDYPVVLHALGEECFLQLAHGYIEEHPPKSASLNYYGALFPAYCDARDEPWRGFAVDLCRLEWALVEAIHASAEPVLDVDALQDLAPEAWAEVQLVPSLALRVLHCAYPVDDYLQAVREEREVDLPEARASVVAVCRRERDLFRLSLTKARAKLLSALTSGLTLNQALDVYLDSPEVAGLEPSAVQGDLRAAFSDWVECGFFRGLTGLPETLDPA